MYLWEDLKKIWSSSQTNVYTVESKTKRPEQHANGRPLSTGMTDECVRASEAVGMEGLLCERNQWGRSLCVRRGGVGRGFTLTMAGIVYQSPSSINQDDPALIGVLVKLVSRPRSLHWPK